MVTMLAPTADNVGRIFAEAVRDERAVREIWVSDDRDHVNVWLYTEPITREQELHLYGLEDVIYDHFEAADVQVHIQHAGLYETTEFVFRAPTGAERIYRAS